MVNIHIQTLCLLVFHLILILYFKVYSPDWSLFGHATVTISGASAGAVTAIQIRDSNNRLITSDYGLTLNGNFTETVKITNAPAGNYTVIAQSSEDVVVTVTLGD